MNSLSSPRPQAGLGMLCCLMLPMLTREDEQLLIRRALIKENYNKHVVEPQVGVALRRNELVFLDVLVYHLHTFSCSQTLTF